VHARISDRNAARFTLNTDREGSSMSPTTIPATRPRRLARERAPGARIEGIDGPVELLRAPGGYLQVWPRPAPESLKQLYSEQFYEEDKSTYLSDMQAERPYWDAIWTLRREMMEAALPADRRRLLDVGCSGGFLLDHFHQHGWDARGIEPSPRAAGFGREHYGLEIFCGDLLDYPPADAPRFDAIHSAQVLEHVLDPEACVAKIAELLAPGGVVFIEVPNDFNAFQEAAREYLDKPAWWIAPDHHLNYFDYESLAGVLARHGLVELDRVASFPMEMFLLMGDDYVGRPDVGKAAHGRRMHFERTLIDAGRLAELGDLYRALAQASLGRTCGILARRA